MNRNPLRWRLLGVVNPVLEQVSGDQPPDIGRSGVKGFHLLEQRFLEYTARIEFDKQMVVGIAVDRASRLRGLPHLWAAHRSVHRAHHLPREYPHDRTVLGDAFSHEGFDLGFSRTRQVSRDSVVACAACRLDLEHVAVTARPRISGFDAGSKAVKHLGQLLGRR